MKRVLEDSNKKNRRAYVVLFFFFAGLFSAAHVSVYAQQSVNQTAQDIFKRFSGFGSGSGPDTTTLRPADEDSIYVFYYRLNDPQKRQIDTSVWEENEDIITRPLYTHLGNIGTATKPVYFDMDPSINLRTNIEPFQSYMWDASTIPYFQTSKPLTKLGYGIGGDQEQHYFARHTRNITSTLNAGIAFRLTSRLGEYKNQRSNISNFAINANYISKNERWRFRAAYASNTIELQENGGIFFTEKPDESTFDQVKGAIDNNQDYARKNLLPVGLGNANKQASNYFTNIINTGRVISTSKILALISYDLGSKKYTTSRPYIRIDPKIKALIKNVNDSTYEAVDSILRLNGNLRIDMFDTSRRDSIPDSVQVERKYTFFIPKVRIEYTFSFDFVNHLFKDETRNQAKDFYNQYYEAANLPSSDTSTGSYVIQDNIQYQNHTLGAYFFLKNERTDNYVKLFASYLHYTYEKTPLPVGYDFLLGGNLKLDLWRGNIHSDINAAVTVGGWHAGDNYIDANFSMAIPSLKSSLRFGAYHALRSALFSYNKISSFYIAPDTVSDAWEKEYMLRLRGTIDIKPFKTAITVNNYLLSNLFYFDNFYTPKQHGDIINVLQVELKNEIQFLKILHWSSDIWLQYSTRTDVISIPNFITRQRLFIAGRAFGKQDVAVGAEMLLVPDFYAQDYSPLIAQWVYQQQNITSAMTINAFIHFKIRNFYFYIRAEQLHTISVQYRDGAFTYPERNNSMYVSRYFYPSFNLRFGFFWNLIN